MLQLFIRFSNRYLIQVAQYLTIIQTLIKNIFLKMYLKIY